jgi:toxin YoeB
VPPAERPARTIQLDPQFLEDLVHWVSVDPRVAQRLLRLVTEAVRDPFSGIGKPEPLKYRGPAVWSRRLTQEHRVVYLVERDRIVFLQARFHYQR